MAHVRGIGMGGRSSADVLENVAMLCREHHDLLDGRLRPTIERLPLRSVSRGLGDSCRWIGCPDGRLEAAESRFCFRHRAICADVYSGLATSGLRVALAESLGSWIADPFGQ